MDAAAKFMPDPHVVSMNMSGEASATFVGSMSELGTHNVLK